MQSAESQAVLQKLLDPTPGGSDVGLCPNRKDKRKFTNLPKDSHIANADCGYDLAVSGTCPWGASSTRAPYPLQFREGWELVDRPHPGGGEVAVRFVHEQHEIIQLRQVSKVAFADVLSKSLDPRFLASADLGVDLRNVEDIDVDLVRFEQAALADAAAARRMLPTRARGFNFGWFSRIRISTKRVRLLDGID